MPIRVPSHLYRNRHGTFYFRFTVLAIAGPAGRREVRLSLGTEQRRTAIISSLHLIADLPRMLAELRRMTDNNETPPPDFFKLWRLQVIKNAELNTKLIILRDELQASEDQLADMVPRDNARSVVKQAYKAGQRTAHLLAA